MISLLIQGLCQKPIDLLFVLDSSESVGALNWDKIINFTRQVASKFDVQYTRVGVVQYHSTPEVPIALTSFRDKKTLDDAISNIYFKPGATRTDLAILKAIDVFNKAPLRKASRLAIFVIGARSTDLFVSKGKSINATDLIKQPSADLQAGPVAVYAASVSQGLPVAEKLAFENELNILTSNPPLDHIFESATYDDLLKAKSDAVAKKTCIGNPTPPPTNNGSANESIPISSNSTNETLPPTIPMSIPPLSNSTVPPPSSNSTVSSLPSVLSSNKNNTSSLLPKYNLTNLINDAIIEANVTPIPEAGAGTPWPPAQTNCTPNKPSVYGYPDYKTCGNGFEMITLTSHQFTASSTYSKDTGDALIKARHAPYNAVLNNTQNAGAWCAEHQYATTQDSTQYLAIDLGKSQLIGKFSNDNIDWFTYQRTLQGNCDRKSITENVLNPPVNARFIRINPLTWYTASEPAKHDICLRFGIYKCRVPPFSLLPVPPFPFSQSHPSPSPTLLPVPPFSLLPVPPFSLLPVPPFSLLPPSPFFQSHPSPSPTLLPSPSPTLLPSPSPTLLPSPSPTLLPSPSPTLLPSPSPTLLPSPSPTLLPSHSPTFLPVPPFSLLPVPPFSLLPVPPFSLLPVPPFSLLTVPPFSLSFFFHLFSTNTPIQYKRSR
ncbi:hypothetical protein QZH41_013020, partial [Actinostola sp. cb2023]